MNKSVLFRFNPQKELRFVLISWILVVAMFYLSFQVITTRRVAGQFITYGLLGIAGLGVIVPVLWTTLRKRRPLSSLGITADKLAISLVIGLVLAAIQYALTLAKMDLPSFRSLVPLMTMSLAVGLFENIFFRGWVQLRMEESFGLVPGIILSALIYSLYHIGYGMTVSEMAFLMLIGLIYSTVFRLTRSIFIVFPFLTPSGGFYNNVKERLTLPFEATYGFAIVIALMTAVIFLAYRTQSRKAVSHAVRAVKA